eukprot:scaffold6154_cov153-Pinguiococcus_pyrenoidosus.AAC.2
MPEAKLVAQVLVSPSTAKSGDDTPAVLVIVVGCASAMFGAEESLDANISTSHSRRAAFSTVD